MIKEDHIKLKLEAILSILIFVLLTPNLSAAYSWQENEPIAIDGESNPYNLNDADLQTNIRSGKLHALYWPVSVTGSLIPFRPMKGFVPTIAKWLGLHEYPKSEGEGAYYIPFKNGKRPDLPMGFTVIKRNNSEGITFSCAACHSANLFGKKIIGLTNRFPGANQTFHKGIFWTKKLTPNLFTFLFNLTDSEKAMYTRTRDNLNFVEAKMPRVLGLDTSLAHVALALSHRLNDEYATKDLTQAKHPREEPLRTFVADSKPAVWWNVKYKNRWLLDGSVVSGNPILTNLIWNEIGRGTDLHELEKWFVDHPDTIRELTSAVYSTQPPRITDFFSENVLRRRFDLNELKHGESLFNAKCSKCHGQYIKGWSQPDAYQLPFADQLKTVKLNYFAQTPVKNVGTDPNRRLGIHSLLQLNSLQVSKKYGIKLVEQEGYVPPPLEGIWARYPYLHNNSIPNLCEFLKPASQRVKSYWSGEALDPQRDFDFACNGYPLGRKTPAAWKLKRNHYFDTSREGLSNMGHDKGFEELGPGDRSALIRFLQTL